MIKRCPFCDSKRVISKCNKPIYKAPIVLLGNGKVSHSRCRKVQEDTSKIMIAEVR